jgi:hypothetical protein
VPERDNRIETTKVRKDFDVTRCYGRILWMAYCDGTSKYDTSMQLVFVPTTKKLQTMCAQDIFPSFMVAVMNIIKTVGGNTTYRENKSSLDANITHTATNTGGMFLLSNSQMQKMAMSFERSCLGSIEDAYMCIAPSLRMHSRLPATQKAHEHIRFAAHALKKARALGAGSRTPSMDLRELFRIISSGISQGRNGTR